MNLSPEWTGWILATCIGFVMLAAAAREFLHRTGARNGDGPDVAVKRSGKRKPRAGALTMLEDNQRDLVLLHDTNGVVRYASDALLELTGYPRQELIGRQGRELVHDDDLSALLASIHAAHVDGRAPPVLFRLRNREGGYIWVEAEFRHSISRSGEPEILGVARSIARVDAEEPIPLLPAASAAADLPGPVFHSVRRPVPPAKDPGPSLQDLCHAFERREFELHYQPKIALAQNVCTGLEALLRWNTPEGRGRTAQVIAAAESSGFIGMLGEWILRTAAHQSARWRRAGLRYPVAVNLSPSQLRDPGLLRLMRELIARDPELPVWLEIELTERALRVDDLQTADTISELAALGFRFHLDDFSAGQSHLIELARIPLRAVKVDLSVIHALNHGGPAEELLHSLIRISRSRDVKVIAEGVETHRQLQLLQASGCDEAQGFLLSRPTSADHAFPLTIDSRQALDLGV